MRRNASIMPLVLASLLFGGCRGGSAPSTTPHVFQVPTHGEWRSVAGADLAVDDSGLVHVVYGLHSPTGSAQPVEYVRGRPEAGSLRWEGAKTLLAHGGRQVRLVATRPRLHVVAAGLHHLVSADRGEQWRDLTGPPGILDSTDVSAFAIASRGESLLFASIVKPSYGNAPDQGRRELHIGIWTPGNTTSSQAIAVVRSEASYFRVFPELAVSGSTVHVLWALRAIVETTDTTATGVPFNGPLGFGRIEYARSLDGGATWPALRHVPGGDATRSPQLGDGEHGMTNPVALVAEGEEASIYVMVPGSTIELRRPMGSEPPRTVHRFTGETSPVQNETFPVLAVVSFEGSHVATALRETIHKYRLGDPRLLLPPETAAAMRVVLRDGGASDSIARRVKLPRWGQRALRQVVRGDRLYTLWFGGPEASQGRPGGSALFLTIETAAAH